MGYATKKVVARTNWIRESTGGGCQWNRREYDCDGIRFSLCETSDMEEEDNTLVCVYTNSSDVQEVLHNYLRPVVDGEGRDGDVELPQVLQDLQESLNEFPIGFGTQGLILDTIRIDEVEAKAEDYIRRAAQIIECIADLHVGVSDCWNDGSKIVPVFQNFMEACGVPDWGEESFDEIQARLYCDDEDSYGVEYLVPCARLFVDRCIEGWDELEGVSR